jgi:amino acid adenylation domain-containing protein
MNLFNQDDKIVLEKKQNDTLIYHTEEMLWANQQLYPNSATYQISFAYKLKGNFNTDAFEKSMNAYALRNKNFRTLFVGEKGRVKRVIKEAVPVKLEKIKLVNREGLKTLYKEECAKAFHLGKGPLWRVLHIYEEETKTDYLLFIIHHIIFDELSIDFFMDEMVSLYSYEVGIQKNLPVLQPDFTEYIEKKQQLWSESKIRKEEIFWKEKMKQVMPFVELPFYRCPNDERRFRGGRLILPLSENINKKLNEFISSDDRYSANSILRACFMALLYRYFGNTNIASVSPVDDRNKLGFEKIVGFVGNVLPTHIHLDENLTFKTLIDNVQIALEEVQENSSTPLNNVVQMLRSWDGRVTEAPFQVMYEFKKKAKPYELGTDLFLEPSIVDNQMAKLPLTLTIHHDKDMYVVDWEINKHVFDELTIKEISEGFPNLINTLCSAPNEKLGNIHLDIPVRQPERNIELPSPEYFKEFLEEDIENSIVEIFSRRVKEFPKKLAVLSTGKAYSYNQLDKTSTAIAQSLIDKYGKEGSKRFALCFEHEASILPAILGVLKSGNAYIPMDTHSPRERLEQILKDSKASAILLNKTSEVILKETFGNNPPIDAFYIEDLEKEGAMIELELPIIESDDLAYILYTSGSTGKPKGVMQSHKNILHHMRNWTNSLKIGAEDKLTLFSSFAWDSSVQDIFGAILNGATLYPLDLRIKDLKTLAMWLDEKGITVLHATVPLFRKFAKSMSKDKGYRLNKLRIMALGGDAMHKGDIDMYKSLFPPNCYLSNMYGATESSSALYYVVNHDTELDGEIVPIGFPAENTEIIIVKNGVEQRAHSIVGEIGIKSKHIAIGYWENSEVEKQCFSIDRKNPEVKVYMTGDLGRVLENGAVEYVTRKDFQVKIRGFRVGLGELESFFASHEYIKDIIVIAQEDPGEEKELVAYYVLKPNNKNITSETLREYLLNKVPDYMIPRFMVELEALPLTVRGKIDREALPAPQNISRDIKNINIEQARDETEERLIHIWENILQVSPIGIRDNFFSLGGHSLLGFEMFEKVEEDFDIRIEPVALYRGAATVELLANSIKEKMNL